MRIIFSLICVFLNIMLLNLKANSLEPAIENSIVVSINNVIKYKNYDKLNELMKLTVNLSLEDKKLLYSKYKKNMYKNVMLNLLMPGLGNSLENGQNSGCLWSLTYIASYSAIGIAYADPFGTSNNEIPINGILAISGVVGLITSSIFPFIQGIDYVNSWNVILDSYLNLNNVYSNIKDFYYNDNFSNNQKTIGISYSIKI